LLDLSTTKANNSTISKSQAWRANQKLQLIHTDICGRTKTKSLNGLKLGKDELSGKVDESMYRTLVGNLLYLTASKPDILFVVSLLSRFIRFPRGPTYWGGGVDWGD